jgi:chemotaxis methyl-accepting protein methylase
MSTATAAESTTGDVLSAVLALVTAQRGLDLRDYHPNVIHARVREWMSATRCRDVPECLRVLSSTPDEVDRLVDALLIKVTEFFRDAPAFAELRRAVDEIVQRLGAGESLRAWSAACATGEEAYSLAMLLDEACAVRPDIGYEVLGTDVDPAALQTARAGHYSVARTGGLTEETSARYLQRDAAGARIVARLREHVQFATHDLVGRRLAPAEAVVASFDVVLCRNVLIYFTRRLQEKAVDRLAAVLRPGGVLMLGTAESLPDSAAARFTPIDVTCKLYRRKEDRE